MKTITAGMLAHLAGGLTSLATCWRLERTDGTVMGFTDHDQDLVIDGTTYTAMSGYTRSAIQTSAGISVDNLDLEGLLEDAAITEADIHDGKYDYAEIRIFLVNWRNLALGTVKLRRGWLGELTLKRGVYTAELRGLTQALSRSIGELYAVDCRADLGDQHCGVDLTPWTVTGTVTTGGSTRIFTDTARGEASAWFTHGLLTWTAGANAGARPREVKSFEAGTFELWLPMGQTIQAADQYQVYRGCDKRLQTCRDVFENILNYRGEPYVPGLDKALRTPDSHA